MLLRFRCKNFRSIREVQEISLVASKTRSDERNESLISTPIGNLSLLRSAAIYGANASGKSNILNAISEFRRIVSNSWRGWKPDGPIPAYDPFLLDESSRTEETEFDLKFLLEDSVLRYRFSFDKSEFKTESLVDCTKNDRTLFERSSAEKKIRFPKGNLWKTATDLRLLKDIERRVADRPNSLFLSASAQNGFGPLLRIYSELTESFMRMDQGDIPARTNFTTSKCLDGAFRERVRKLIEFADAGISGIEATHREWGDDEKKAFSEFYRFIEDRSLEQSPRGTPEGSTFPPIPVLRLGHAGQNGREYMLDESQESKGTLAYFSAIGAILSTLENGDILLIDELESSLHPKLTKELVKIFNSPEFNPNGAQFIFTTHDSNLLDLDLLRRDQIWFTTKSREGATKLYPLTDFRPRTSQNIETAYLSGRFGATPYFDEELLREAISAGTSKQLDPQSELKEK